MAKYIKSHSNYVLRTKHQTTNDGTIFERDITTIGGRDQFARGQVPIYKTGNFVITINNDINDYRKISDKDWHRNDEGEIWTIKTLKNYEKDEKSSDDRKIVIKKDYHDIRDYAYYGSCAEMMRTSINDILRNYPGELFVPYETLYVGNDGSVQYTKEAAELAFGEHGYTASKTGIKGYYTSFQTAEEREVVDECGNKVTLHSVSLIDPLTDDERKGLEMGIPYTREFKYITDQYGNLLETRSLSLIDNPFGINIHDKYVPSGENPLKYFADGGIDNYVAYIKDDIDDEWHIDVNHEYSITIENILFDGIGEGEIRQEYFSILGGNCPNNSCEASFNIDITSHEEVEKKLSCKLNCIDPGKYIGRIELCFRKNDYSFKTTPGLQRDDDGNPIIMCCDGTLDFPSEGSSEGKYNNNDTQIESFRKYDCAEYTDGHTKLTIYMFMGNNNEIKYLVDDIDFGGNINFNYNDCIESGSATARPDFTGTFAYYNFLVRIRPKEEIIEDYFNNLDLFEKVLLDRNSDPIYTATFELLGENDYGNYTYLKQFTFPTTYGGYNLGSKSQSFTSYVNSLSEIGEYYDGKYTDNLWRSLTHESIKNFDWTYTRHFTPGDEEPFVEAGTKIQKVIRLYGREFDEINTYIDAIDDLNTVTYDNINNLPDYFFTDKLEEQGWDVKLIHPLVLSEYVNGHMSVPVDIHTLFPRKYDEEGNKICTEQAEQLNYFYDNPLHGEHQEERTEVFDVTGGNCPNENCETSFSIGVTSHEEVDDLTEYYDRNKITIQRVFNQDFNELKAVPYSCSNITTVRPSKYCALNPESDSCVSTYDFEFDSSTLQSCIEPGQNVEMTSISKSGEYVANGYHNDCGDIIRIYCDENEYASSDVNNEFMKRLLLNSPEIWRHKGTIEGMEMLLALFGLRSKNRVFTDEKYFVNQKDLNGVDGIANFNADVNSISGCGDDNKFNIKLEANSENCLSPTDLGKWYYKNYLDKLYNLYDYDIKEYTLFTTHEDDEWIPEKNMYKYDWVNSTKLISYPGQYTSYQGLPISYEDKVNYDGEITRELYPYFNSNESYDGNPYYQMSGGWMQKRPFMFDSKNNIITEDYESDNRKNKSLFTETIKNIKCVQTLGDLLSNPSLANNNGDICQVSDLSGRFAVIDGFIYPLYSEYNTNESDDNGHSFFYVSTVNNTLSVGNALFTDYVIISNPYATDYKERIELSNEYYANNTIKIYILEKEEDDEETGGKKKVYDIDVYSKENSISTFTVFENGKYMEGDNYTNYFRLNNVDYYNELSVLGWQQLKDDEYEYYKLNAITDYREGNNPHTGHMNYDNGHEYLTYFQRIFKKVIDDDLIDYRRYNESDIQFTVDIRDLGFKNLIDGDDCEHDYDKYLREDSKCHFFGVISSKINDACNDARSGLSCFEKREKANSSRYYKDDNGKCKPKEDSYKLTDIFRKSIIDDSEGNPKIKNLKYGEIYDELGEYAEHFNNETQEWEEGYDADRINNSTKQIVNTKRMEIEFFIKNRNEYSKEWLEEVKYIDSVILPYLSQMIPSTVIWRVKYTTKDKQDWCNVNSKSCSSDKFYATPSKIKCVEGQNQFNINLVAENS